MSRHVMMILGKDVHNKGTVKIYEELIRRNISVDVYATTFSDSHTMLFDRLGVDIHDIACVDEKKLKYVDYIFSAVPILDRKVFRNANRYIFMNPSTYFNENFFSGDFIFTVRDISKPLNDDSMLPIERMNYWKSLPAMATGGPQFELGEAKRKTDSKVILFIDAGHYPFGTKKELADYIVEIAEYCPDYEIRVKPRYLPGDTNTTHKNKENVFRYLYNRSNLPKNLKLIDTHTELKDELRDVSLVICPEGTTSYVEVILQKVPILIFTGFPNKDNILWSKARGEFSNSIPSKLECRIYYRDIFKYLPKGVEIDPKRLKNIQYKNAGVAADIVGAMEFIYCNYLMRDKFPNRMFYYSEDYKCVMKADESESWTGVKKARRVKIIYDTLCTILARLYIPMDMSCLIDFLNKCQENLDEENMPKVIEQAQDILYDIFIQNKEKMSATAYEQSVLCMAMYKKNRLCDFKPDEMKCEAYYSYCLARQLFDQGNYETALKRIERYFSIVDKNVYEISLADSEAVKIMAHYYCGAILFHLGEACKSYQHLKICDEAWHGNHIQAAKYLQQITHCDEVKKV